MRCSKAKDYLGLEIDGQLPPDAALPLREHLDGCAECRDYQADLGMGRRLLEATAPELPENFDWKLQLRLNQALRERAGETAYPWDEERPDRWHFLRNFTTAAAVGMAAVLAVAVFLGPARFDLAPDAAAPTVAESATEATSDRLPLNLNRNGFGGAALRNVSGAQGGLSSRQSGLELGWSGDRMQDLRTIQRLRANNQQLTRALVVYQREIQRLHAQLDTAQAAALDLPENGE